MDRAPGGLYVTPAPAPASTMVAPWPVKANGMTSISSGRFLCWASQRVPATIREGPADAGPFSCRLPPRAGVPRPARAPGRRR